MAVGKEALLVLENLAAMQTRIYPDACDVGIIATPEITKMIRDALAELKDLEGGKVIRWSTGLAYETRLGFEFDCGRVQGVKVRVSLNKDRKREFFSIDIHPDSWEVPTHIPVN